MLKAPNQSWLQPSGHAAWEPGICGTDVVGCVRLPSYKGAPLLRGPCCFSLNDRGILIKISTTTTT